MLEQNNLTGDFQTGPQKKIRVGRLREDCKPEISVVNKNNRIEKFTIKCSCGQEINVVCNYEVEDENE